MRRHLEKEIKTELAPNDYQQNNTNSSHSLIKDLGRNNNLYV